MAKTATKTSRKATRLVTAHVIIVNGVADAEATLRVEQACSLASERHEEELRSFPKLNSDRPFSIFKSDLR